MHRTHRKRRDTRRHVSVRTGVARRLPNDPMDPTGASMNPHLTHLAQVVDFDPSSGFWRVLTLQGVSLYLQPEDMPMKGVTPAVGPGDWVTLRYAFARTGFWCATEVVEPPPVEVVAQLLHRVVAHG
jgi:hypothetical protein